ncbi:MAG: peptidoglycan-binding protein [Clostridia bacterium]
MADIVKVPEFITVHLGAPNSNAPNVRVPFSTYIKNVASSEIYPTWPENAIRANIIAQTSFAINRIYTEFYHSQGYDFDITNSTQFDQAYQQGRDIFANIGEIAEGLFNQYVVKQGSVQPLFTEYCDGDRVQCGGLSQWGTVSLASQGKSPYEILQTYYGNDIDLKRAQTSDNIESYPGTALKLGSVSEEVRTIQKQLNRISRNYPLIPIIPNTNGIFEEETRNAVKVFQGIFNLTQDGIVGRSTWYTIKRIYSGVKKLSELYSEGITVSEAQRQFPRTLQIGSNGQPVRVLQYYLRFISFFDKAIPFIQFDGVYGQETANAVRAFQTQFGLTPDGITGAQTWNKIIAEYDDILKSLPYEYSSYSSLLYPGYVLTTGATGKVVEQIQTYLRVISQNNSKVPDVVVDGVYGASTANAVKAVQNLYGIPAQGVVGPLTWNSIVNLYNDYRDF